MSYLLFFFFNIYFCNFLIKYYYLEKKIHTTVTHQRFEHWQTASAAAALVSISHLQMRQTRQDLKHFSLLISHLLRLYSVFFHKDVCIVSPPIKGCVKIRPASTPMTGLYKVKLCESKIVLDGQWADFFVRAWHLWNLFLCAAAILDTSKIGPKLLWPSSYCSSPTGASFSHRQWMKSYSFALTLTCTEWRVSDVAGNDASPWEW